MTQYLSFKKNILSNNRKELNYLKKFPKHTHIHKSFRVFVVSEKEVKPSP